MDTGVAESPSLNSQWAPLNVYHNKQLPNSEVCIVLVPQRPICVTYLDVLDKRTMTVHSFLHIPDIPVTASKGYTPFPVLENERSFPRCSTVPPPGRFDIARAVESDIGTRMASELIDTLAESSPDTMLPLQRTIDGYYWKSPRHWLTVEPRLKQFHKQDHIYVLADVVLQIRNIVQAAFCARAEATATICEVFFRAAVSSPRRNLRTLPVLSLADMQSVASDANDSLTIKALMCTIVNRKAESFEGEFHPLETLVSDPWLLFALRAFLPRDSPLFALLQTSKRLEPVERPVVLTVRETVAEETATEYVRLWTDTPVDVTTREGYGEEGIEVVTITSPIVAQMDSDGTLGRNVAESGGISSTHGQSQHTTVVILTGDTAYTYDDTIPFLIKVCGWDKNELRGRLDGPMHALHNLIAVSHPFSDDDPTADGVL
jgi:hypothetical protein